jgi:hypothetical protein
MAIDGSVKRKLQITEATFNYNLAEGMIVEEATDFYYIPLAVSSFAPDDLSITNVDSVTSNTKLTSLVSGKFDKVRVGDVIKTLSAGVVAAKATFNRDCFVPTGLKYVIYPSTYDNTTLAVQSGDAVTGTGIPASTHVVSIDYTNRRIILNNAATATGINTLVFAPPIRVTAVRPSTATGFANEIDIDSTVTTGASGATLTVGIGAKQAVFQVIRLTPVGSSTDGKLSVTVSASILDGKEVKGSIAGLNGIDFSDLSYFTVGTYAFDLDAFLETARLTRPLSA